MSGINALSGDLALAALLDRLERRYVHTGIPACPECGLGGSDHEVIQLVRIVREATLDAKASINRQGGLVAAHERARELACEHNVVRGELNVHAGISGAC